MTLIRDCGASEQPVFDSVLASVQTTQWARLLAPEVLEKPRSRPDGIRGEPDEHVGLFVALVLHVGSVGLTEDLPEVPIVFFVRGITR